ncbi:MAG TPA: STAS domain-containing protein [Catenuloplanes sp.]
MQATAIDHPQDMVVLSLHGDLDTSTAAALQEALDALLTRPAPRIVVDLAQLRFCDSVGLGSFVTGRRAAADRGGWLRLARPNPFLGQLLSTVGLTRYLAIHRDLATAAVP